MELERPSARGGRTRPTAPSRSTARRSRAVRARPLGAQPPPDEPVALPRRSGRGALERLKAAADARGAAKLDRAPTLVVVSSSTGDSATRRTATRPRAPRTSSCSPRTRRGLAAYWRTPAVLRTPAGRAALGVGEDEQVARPAAPRRARARSSACPSARPVDETSRLPRLRPASSGPATGLHSRSTTVTQIHSSALIGRVRSANPNASALGVLAPRGGLAHAKHPEAPSGPRARADAGVGVAACGGDDDDGGGGSGDPAATHAPAQDRRTRRRRYTSYPDYLDPALRYTQEGWQALWTVYTPLLTYKHEEGAERRPAHPRPRRGAAGDHRGRQDLHAQAARGPEVLRRHGRQGQRLRAHDQARAQPRVGRLVVLPRASSAPRSTSRPARPRATSRASRPTTQTGEITIKLNERRRLGSRTSSRWSSPASCRATRRSRT